jgi:sortase A
MPEQAQAADINSTSSGNFRHEIEENFHKAISLKAAGLDNKNLYRSYPVLGSDVGTITFPSLGLSWSIYQGTEDAQLAKGVGHYLQSVLPGETDNTVLAGHRETVFNKLGDLKIGQKIYVSTTAGYFVYKIRNFRVVDRSDKTVIVPTPKAVLTLVTCYPINYIGITHQTFVVSADLVDSELAIR